MIVIGLDVHKRSVTAVAVDEAGRPLEEKVIAVGSDELLGWASLLDAERLWAVEDCRQLTGWLERQLLSVGEELVRVPPKLTVPERRAGRTRGKSDPIDALAIARAALREPDLSRPRPDERIYRELKLLVDYRDDLVDQRRRTQQRLRWHLHQLDPTYEVPLRRLDRLGSTRSSNNEQQRSRRRYSSYPAAPRSPPRSCSPRSARLTASEATRNSPVMAASHRSKQAQAAHNATGSTAAATANSTPRSTGSRSPRPATTPQPAPTSTARKPKARAGEKRSAASNASSSAPSTRH